MLYQLSYASPLKPKKNNTAARELQADQNRDSVEMWKSPLSHSLFVRLHVFNLYLSPSTR